MIIRIDDIVNVKLFDSLKSFCTFLDDHESIAPYNININIITVSKSLYNIY